MSNHVPVAELPNVDPNFIPRDDASMAAYIAKQYRDAGIDPKSAYDNTDEALSDFGGPQAFI